MLIFVTIVSNLSIITKCNIHENYVHNSHVYTFRIMCIILHTCNRTNTCNPPTTAPTHFARARRDEVTASECPDIAVCENLDVKLAIAGRDLGCCCCCCFCFCCCCCCCQAGWCVESCLVVCVLRLVVWWVVFFGWLVVGCLVGW